ncbi:MAG TPA: hypothetical protein VGD80_02205, partial [Kofleriaceae bacterium]
EAKVTDIGRKIEVERAAEQERKAREAREQLEKLAREREREREILLVRPNIHYGGPEEPLGVRRPYEPHPTPVRPSVPPAHVVRPARGGGVFGGRRRDPGRPPPVRLVA